MGIEAAVLGPLLGATVGTAGSFIAQSANASSLLKAIVFLLILD